MVGLAADHRAEARDACERARARGVARRERQLERTGDVERLHPLHARLLERALGPRDEPLRELLVKARDDDREARRGHSAGRSRSSRSRSRSA